MSGYYPASFIPNAVALYDFRLAVSAASFDVQNISADYRHLRLVLNGRSDRAAQVNDGVGIRFNNDSGANYEYQQALSSDVTMTASESFAQTSFYAGDVPAASATANVAGASIVEILDYAGTTFHKHIIAQNARAGSATTITVQQLGGRWASATAINRITVISTTSNNFIAGTRLTIYGY